MAKRSLSQSELARRVGVSQATIYKLTTGETYGSKSLHRIARELGTTPAYLTGETDDPDEGAPPPPPEPRYQHVTMQVALPSESALTRMFQGLLASMTGHKGLPNLGAVDQATLARELALLLPAGLSTLRGPLRYEASAGGDDARWQDLPPIDEDRERQRA